MVQSYLGNAVSYLRSNARQLARTTVAAGALAASIYAAGCGPSATTWRGQVQDLTLGVENYQKAKDELTTTVDVELVTLTARVRAAKENVTLTADVTATAQYMEAQKVMFDGMNSFMNGAGYSPISARKGLLVAVVAEAEAMGRSDFSNEAYRLFAKLEGRKEELTTLAYELKTGAKKLVEDGTDLAAQKKDEDLSALVRQLQELSGKVKD